MYSVQCTISLSTITISITTTTVSVVCTKWGFNKTQTVSCCTTGGGDSWNKKCGKLPVVMSNVECRMSTITSLVTRGPKTTVSVNHPWFTWHHFSIFCITTITLIIWGPLDFGKSVFPTDRIFCDNFQVFLFF